MKRSTGLRFALLFAVAPALWPIRAAAQTTPTLPSPLGLADVIRVAIESNNSMSTPRARCSASPDLMEQWRQPGAAVPLGDLADVRVTTGPPTIKDENGVLVGYVFADIDQTQRDLGGWVDDAKAVVASQLTLPPGYRLQWTGQYEFLAAMEARLRHVIPLTLVLVVALLYLSMRGWPQTFLVLSSLPFAVAGNVWLLAFMDYNLSTAVWVGLIGSHSRTDRVRRPLRSCVRDVGHASVGGRRPSDESAMGRGVVL